MNLYIDINNRKLITSLTDSTTPSRLSFTSGDSEPIKVFLLQKGSDNTYALMETTAGDTVRAAIARFSGTPKVLTVSDSATAGDDGAFDVILPLSTVNISTALGDDASINPYFEVELSYADGNVATVFQSLCTLKGDLIENTPSDTVVLETYQSFLAKCKQYATGTHDISDLPEDITDDLINEDDVGSALYYAKLAAIAKAETAVLLSQLSSGETSIFALKMPLYSGATEDGEYAYLVLIKTASGVITFKTLTAEEYENA